MDTAHPTKVASKENVVEENAMTSCVRSCSKKAPFLAMTLLQILIIILFAIFVKYDTKGGENVNNYYPMFQDVNVMIFVGFGYLMTFLKRYGYSSFGFNLLLGALCIEVAILTRGFIDMLRLKESFFALDLPRMFTSEFSAATVLITFGALLGKASLFQLIIAAVIEVILAAINELIISYYLQAVDVGGSMLIHAFGAYFGLAIARVLYKDDVENSPKEGSVYHSDLFTLIGTIFLWCFWPSFNGGLVEGEQRYRAILNTLLSLAACTIVTFIVSSILDRKGKIDMVHIQNSTIAGGVAVGTTADFIIYPYGAILLGSAAGVLSVVGFKFITPFMRERLKIHDTCGVHNLHGMPGVLAAVAGAISASLATFTAYGDGLYSVFPARLPVNSTDVLDLTSDGRSASMQGVYQTIALFCTLGISIGGGLLTGLLLKISVWGQPRHEALFEDSVMWNLPDDTNLQEIVSGEEENLISDI